MHDGVQCICKYKLEQVLSSGCTPSMLAMVLQRLGSLERSMGARRHQTEGQGATAAGAPLVRLRLLLPQAQITTVIRCDTKRRNVH